MKSHREIQQLPVYWLVVAEGGPKLRDSGEEAAFDAARGRDPEALYDESGEFPVLCQTQTQDSRHLRRSVMILTKTVLFRDPFHRSHSYM